ncbi:methyltransferase domain-containing protein, partial [Thermodesulfobacteriota bacterium]
MDSEKDSRWTAAQLKEDAFWQRKDVFETQMQRVTSRYGPVIGNISKKIHSDAIILDVGCGPTCASQLFDTGLNVFLDPLMDSYKKSYPETLPEGDKISGTAEDIPFKDESIEVAVCFNALDHM